MPEQRNDAPEELDPPTPDAEAEPDVADASSDAEAADATETEAVSVAPFIDDEDDDAEDSSDATEDTDTEDDATAAAADKGAGKAKTSGKDKSSGKDKDAEKAAERTVTRRQVTSKRVTPKGGGPAVATGPKKKGGKGGSPAADESHASRRYTPPGQGAYAQPPSPVWVPVLMFALLIIGALIIITNYAGLFGPAENIRLVLGLAFILGGIITATQYR